MDNAIQMHPVIMTREITHANVLGAQAVVSTILTRTHRRRPNRLAGMHSPSDLAPCEVASRFGTKNGKAASNRFCLHRQRR